MSKIEKPKNKKRFYAKQPNKRFTLDVNIKGFLCSCNNREKDCIRESYNILNKYADIIWPEKPQESSKDLEGEGDVEDELQKELNELKSEKISAKRFQVIDSGAKNFLFIKTTVEDPVKLAETILNEIFEKKSQETRFLLRLIPVETTCKAHVKDIENTFKLLCEKHFSTTSKTFSIIFNHRNNNSVSRDEVIKNIAGIVAAHGNEKNLDHKVDLKNAEVSIIVEVIRGFAFLGVVPNFYKLKKYNLLAFGEKQELGSSSSLNEVPSLDTAVLEKYHENVEENNEIKDNDEN